MKRLLLCIILAIGFHAIILSADLSWLELAPQPALKSKSIAIVLAPGKTQNPEPEADSLRMKPLVPQKDAAINEIQPEPHIYQKPEKNPDSVKIPAPVRPKKNLKPLTLKKETIKAAEKIHSASADKLDFSPSAEAKTGISIDSDIQAPGLPNSPDSAFIKKTKSMPSGFSEPLTTAAAGPATEAKEILSESPHINLARPLYKQNTSPNYPLRARRMGYEGLVLLKVLVAENGRVADLEVLKSSGYSILDLAAISSVKTWLFEPGTEDGKKKKMWIKIPIRFQLE